MSGFNGKNLADLRARFELTQTAFADEIGISVRVLRQYEHGERPVPRIVARSCMLLELVPPVKSIGKPANDG